MMSFSSIFEILHERISNKLFIKEINSDEILLSSDIRNSAGANEFVKEYAAVTHSRFRATMRSRGKLFSTPGMTWICTYRRMNPDTLKMTPKCPAFINIKIKKVTKFTKMKDGYLRGNSPMRTMIKILSNHNHIIEDRSLDRYLKVSSPVKECFYEYFKRGIFGVKAKRFHEQNLKKANFYTLDDESMNPSMPGVDALYKHWMKLKKNAELNKVSTSKDSDIVNIRNVATDNMTQLTSNNSNIICKYEVDPVENTNYQVPNVLQNFSHDEEDTKPILNIKKEIDDDGDDIKILNTKEETDDVTIKKEIDDVTIKEEVDDVTIKKEVDDDSYRLPIIESYGSLATPSMNSAPVMKASASNSQFVVYDASSNTFKVIKYLSVGQKFINNDHSSSQYNSYLPRTLLPSRVPLHRV